MSKKWNPNWLIFFTATLFITVLITFVVTVRNQFGLKKCVYGGKEYVSGEAIPDEPRCFCNSKGEVICEEIETENTLESAKYINDDLEFSSSFLNFIDIDNNFESMRFGEVSTVDKGLKVVVERLSMCSGDESLPPQIGYYMLNGDELFLTTSTNLLNENFSRECMVSNTYMIHGLSEVSKILYQSEDNRVIEADICVYEGRVFNKGDAFVGENGDVVVCD